MNLFSFGLSILLLLLLLASDAQASRFIRSPPVDSSKHDETVAYWTPERMRAAIPMDDVINININNEHVVRGEDAMQDTQNETKPTIIRGYSAGQYFDGIDMESFSLENVEDDDNKRNAKATRGTLPFSSAFLSSNQYTTFPYRTMGKIFYVNNGQGYVCSGIVVGEYTVYTAGHCLYGNNFYTSVVFVPGYNNGNRPYGTFSANTLVAPNEFKFGWTPSTGSAMGYDLGIIILNKLNGNSIRATVGNFAVLFNGATYASYTAYGYPAASPFNGESIYYCTNGQLYLTDSYYTPAPIGVGCDATPGSSGGPRLLYYPPTGYTYLNGVNSYSNSQQVSYGAYFGTVAQDLYNYANTFSP